MGDTGLAVEIPVVPRTKNVVDGNKGNGRYPIVLIAFRVERPAQGTLREAYLELVIGRLHLLGKLPVHITRDALGPLGLGVGLVAHDGRFHGAVWRQHLVHHATTEVDSSFQKQRMDGTRRAGEVRAADGIAAHPGPVEPFLVLTVAVLAAFPVLIDGLQHVHAERGQTSLVHEIGQIVEMARRIRPHVLLWIDHVSGAIIIQDDATTLRLNVGQCGRAAASGLAERVWRHRGFFIQGLAPSFGPTAP